MSNKECHKTLKKHEARYRYWHLLKVERDFFPPENVEFKVEFAGKTNVLKVNHKNVVMTGQFYEKYKFLENDRIILTKKKPNLFLMDAPDTKLYPKI
jgi:hypothetical protein